MSVIEESAAKAGELSSDKKGLTDFIASIYKIAGECVRSTEEAASARSTERIPDAGALSFFYFLQGIFGFSVGAAKEERDEKERDEEAGYRNLEDKYSVEFCLEWEEADIDTVKELLGDISQNVIVADNGKRLKVHLNCMDPKHVFDKCSRLGGKLSGIKVSDFFQKNVSLFKG
jgi:dihydroxyacetone kinase-like predicted kinase